MPPEHDALTGVRAIAAGGFHSCALMTTGGVRCWGCNDWGQLGETGATDVADPPTSDFMTGVEAVAAGHDHTCVLMSDGAVRCWGADYDGQLGHGHVEQSAVPLPVRGTCE